MATKYYQAHNASRMIAGERFEIVEIIGGTALGVFRTDSPELMAEIDKLVTQKVGVTEITARQYEDAVKKKAPNFNNLPHSNRQPAQVRLSQVAGVVLDGDQRVEPEPDKLESVEAALSNVGKVESPSETE